MADVVKRDFEAVQGKRGLRHALHQRRQLLLIECPGIGAGLFRLAHLNHKSLAKTVDLVLRALQGLEERRVREL